MNRRTLKKKCRRAMAILIEQHGYGADSFKPADREEAVYAPAAMERRFVRHGFLNPGPLKGTPLLWTKDSYEYDEWSANLPCEVLNEIEFWQNFEPSEKDLAA